MWYLTSIIGLTARNEYWLHKLWLFAYKKKTVKTDLKSIMIIATTLQSLMYSDVIHCYNVDKHDHLYIEISVNSVRIQVAISSWKNIPREKSIALSLSPWNFTQYRPNYIICLLFWILFRNQYFLQQKKLHKNKKILFVAK